MATVLITNIDTAPVGIADLYTTIPVGGSVTTQRSTSQLASMASLHAAAAAAKVTVAVTLSADELASGLATVGAVEAQDIAPVAATAVAAAEVQFRKAFTSVASTDIPVFAANALPYKMRIVDAYLLISTVQAGSTLQLFPQAAGAGTAVTGATSAAVAGKIPMPLTGNVSQVLTPGALIGLFLLPSAHSGIVGELVVVARRES